MQIDYLSTGIGMIAGAVLGVGTGITIEYYANILTDRRREKEKQKAEDEEFAKVAEQMPDLFLLMKTDLEKSPCIRQFFVCSKGTFNTIEPCFKYHGTDIHDLRGKIHVLENHGYVWDRTQGKAPKYRMTETFVEYLLEGDFQEPPTSDAKVQGQ